MTIRKAANGKYRVAAFGKRNPATGARATRSATVDTYAEAKRAERRLQDELDATVAGPRTTVGGYLAGWLEAREHDWAFNTFQRYQASVAHLTRELGKVKLDKLTRPMVKQAYSRLASTGGANGGALSARTVKTFHLILQQALNDAVKDGILMRNPAVDAFGLRIEDVEAQIPSPEDVAALMKQLRPSRYYTAALLMIATGVRRGEAAALQWADFNEDLTAFRIRRSAYSRDGEVHTKAPKTKSGVRTIALPETLAANLRAHRVAQKTEALKFGWPREALTWCFVQRDGTPVSPANLTSCIRQASRRSGVSISPHQFRHLHISQLLDAGLSIKEVQMRAGHSRPTVTLDVYSHLLNDNQTAAVETAGKALKDFL